MMAMSVNMLATNAFMQPLEMCHIGTKTGRTTMILISRENQMRRAKFLKEQQGEMEVEMEAEILILPNLKNQSEEVKQVEED
jgi:hypothetical protein